jgi:hypothetical protein
VLSSRWRPESGLVSDEAHEVLRDLARAREGGEEDQLRRLLHRLSKLLLRYGLRQSGESTTVKVTAKYTNFTQGNTVANSVPAFR